MVPSGELNQLFELQRPEKTRNEAGETETTWVKVRRFWGSYEATTYGEQSRRGQVGGNLQATVTCRWMNGVDGSLRLVWKSNGDRVLMISSVVPLGIREDLELTVEEHVT